jgi:hypothetical protein
LPPAAESHKAFSPRGIGNLSDREAKSTASKCFFAENLFSPKNPLVRAVFDSANRLSVTGAKAPARVLERDRGPLRCGSHGIADKSTGDNVENGVTADCWIVYACTLSSQRVFPVEFSRRRTTKAERWSPLTPDDRGQAFYKGRLIAYKGRGKSPWAATLCRIAATGRLDFLPETRDVRADDTWRVADAPADLADRNPPDSSAGGRGTWNC